MLWLLGLPLAGAAEDEIWLLVDTESLTLEVKKGDKTVEKMDNIAIGRNGAGFKTHRGDDITPLGLYRIGWINRKSPYYRFFGLSYPSAGNAALALEQGIIDSETFDSIVSAHNNRRVPPQNTTLGGQIGIHGIGRGDEKIHKTMNWTHGCIALTNHQIDRLSRWVKEEIIVKVK
ncbi:MAG: L,D-transpeptidase family protein [Gammaproteobacteria bacterium]